MAEQKTIQLCQFDKLILIYHRKRLTNPAPTLYHYLFHGNFLCLPKRIIPFLIAPASYTRALEWSQADIGDGLVVRLVERSGNRLVGVSAKYTAIPA